VVSFLEGETGAPPDRRAKLRFHGQRVLVALVVAALTYLLFPASPVVDVPVLEVGSVAPDNVIAPFAFAVTKTPDELAKEREEIARSVDPIFRAVPAALDSSRIALARFAEALNRAVSESAGDADRAAAARRVAESLGIRLTQAEAAYLAQPGRASAITDALRRVFDRWLATGVTAAGALDALTGVITLRRDSTERKVNPDSMMTFPALVSRAQLMHPDLDSPIADSVFRKLLAAFFHPTIVYDHVGTQRARQELRRSVSAVKYELQPGQKIVGWHEVVGKKEQDVMRSLRQEVERRIASTRNTERIAGAVMLNSLLLTIFGLSLLLFRPQLYASMRAILLFAGVSVVVLTAASVIAHAPNESHPELIPVAFAAVILSLLFDPRISMVAAMILAVLIGGQSEFRGTNALFLNLVGGTAAAFAVRIIRRRNQSHYAMLAVAAAYLLGALAIGLTLDRPFSDISHSALWGALNAVVSVALAIVLLPPAEQFAGVDTYFTLLEWSDLNRPLLRRMSLEAPGTYAHTIAIANLTESACNAIGANGLLGRVGAYYHDIGKLKKPQYFVENQAKGRNPHDKLKPSTSASIIRNHVREGMELADEFKLPRAVRPFITEHHGTNPISYFLEKAKERDGMPGNTAEFAYPGPVPQSAETAICMLADGVEAAVRVLHDPTPQKIREVIERIVRQRMEQGQLREAPITLKQLELAKEQFARVLTGMYHTRIDYPTASGGVTSEFAAV
jgi:putative nucleotidyltransferase with HDIG domain